MRLVAVGRIAGGYSPADQARDMRRWARLNKSTIVGEILFDSGASKTITSDERLALSGALDAIKARAADGLLVPTIDRLAGDVFVQEAALGYVWAHGGRVFSADAGEILEDDPDDPMRTFMRQMYGIFRDLEHALLARAGAL